MPFSYTELSVIISHNTEPHLHLVWRFPVSVAPKKIWNESGTNCLEFLPDNNVHKGPGLAQKPLAGPFSASRKTAFS